MFEIFSGSMLHFNSTVTNFQSNLAFSGVPMLSMITEASISPTMLKFQRGCEYLQFCVCRKTLPLCASAVNSRWNRATVPFERILRYPDGAVRTIRYPMPQDAKADAEFEDFWESDEDSWGVCRENDDACQNSFVSVEDALPGSAPHGLLWADEIRVMLDAAASRHDSVVDALSSRGGSSAVSSAAKELPSSPAALLAFLQSPDYKREKEILQQRINASYCILTGCPWVEPKPVAVIASRKAGQEYAMTYTLPTRMTDEGQSAEMSQVLNMPQLMSMVNVDHMREGVVCFEDIEEASEYLELLEDVGHLDVVVIEVDSHELFRMTRDVDAVVVLMGQGDLLPRPHQLAAALGGRASMDDFVA